MKDTKHLSQLFSGENRLTIVIGSGVNCHAIGNKKTILTNWAKLLDAAFDKKSKVNSQNYILDFERRIVEMTSKQDDKAAQKVQNEILEKLCNNIEKEQIKKRYSTNYPTYLFNNDIVANVVSLNFDLIPEHILTGGKIPRLGKSDTSISEFKGSNMQRYREINGVRFWHPHGDIKKIDSLVLGMRQYINNLDHLEVMRKKHKHSERKNKNEEKTEERPSSTWYEAVVNHPVIVLGASLSDNELDIWGALINRERNFAKGINRREFRPPIYTMWSECESGRFNKPDWVKPIFPSNFRYEEQWQKLKSLFENHGKQ
jgi:hypothetical protein